MFPCCKGSRPSVFIMLSGQPYTHKGQNLLWMLKYGRHSLVSTSVHCKTSCLWCDNVSHFCITSCHVEESHYNETNKWLKIEFLLVKCEMKDADALIHKIPPLIWNWLWQVTFQTSLSPPRMAPSECIEHPHCPTSFNRCKLTLWCFPKTRSRWPERPSVVSLCSSTLGSH